MSDLLPTFVCPECEEVGAGIHIYSRSETKHSLIRSPDDGEYWEDLCAYDDSYGVEEEVQAECAYCQCLLIDGLTTEELADLIKANQAP